VAAAVTGRMARKVSTTATMKMMTMRTLKAYSAMPLAASPKRRQIV